MEEPPHQYDDLAGLTVPELQNKVRQQAVHHPSERQKGEFLEALSGEDGNQND